MAKLRERSVLSGILVREIMRRQVVQLPESASIGNAVNHLIRHRSNALLVTEGQGKPRGVVSKTDLILAYRHGVPAESEASTILTSANVASCDEEELIEEAIKKMIFSGVHRLFVRRQESPIIVGVFSLSDAARLRSGSCRACVTTRIKVEENT